MANLVSQSTKFIIRGLVEQRNVCRGKFIDLFLILFLTRKKMAMIRHFGDLAKIVV